LISQVEIFHGAAIVRLFRASSQAVSIRADAQCRSSYVLDERFGLYIKYSANRMSPWPFSFRVEHQEEIDVIASEYESVFVVLVCGTDGIACLDLNEYRLALDEEVEPGEWIKVSRKRREKYTVTGSDVRRAFKIADSEYPSKILAGL
jgi:hypothetical protein